MDPLRNDFRSRLRDRYKQMRDAFRDTLTYVSILTEPFVATRAWLSVNRSKKVKHEKIVIFIRHPHTNEEHDGIFRGDHAEVTDKGKTEARLVAERIANLSLVTHIVTSTLPRSQQLAKTIALAVAQHGLSMPAFIPSDLFVEIKKPTEFLDVHRKHPEVVRISHRMRRLFDLDYRYSDEENRWRVELRLFHALRLLSELDARYVVVVTHGKFMRALWHFLYRGGRFRRFYQEADRVLELEHTGIVICRMRPSFRTGTIQWNLSSWNDVGHRQGFNIQDLIEQLSNTT